MAEPLIHINAPGEAEMMDETIPLLPGIKSVSTPISGMSRGLIFALLTTVYILVELALLGVSPQTQVGGVEAFFVHVLDLHVQLITSTRSPKTSYVATTTPNRVVNQTDY